MICLQIFWNTEKKHKKQVNVFLKHVFRMFLESLKLQRLVPFSEIYLWVVIFLYYSWKCSYFKNVLDKLSNFFVSLQIMRRRKNVNGICKTKMSSECLSKIILVFKIHSRPVWELLHPVCEIRNSPWSFRDVEESSPLSLVSLENGKLLCILWMHE